jgi:hypothetical protein
MINDALSIMSDATQLILSVLWGLGAFILVCRNREKFFQDSTSSRDVGSGMTVTFVLY